MSSFTSCFVLLVTGCLVACASPGSGNAVLLPQCTNQVQDPNELGLDCGGPCPVCALATCSNGARDPNESDVDCGGPCADCALNQACNTNTDCASGNCAAGFCASPAACDDGEQNGGESDLDCGGNCTGCGALRRCAKPSDCLSGVCTEGVCAEPATCRDGEKAPEETDTDCGGPCRPCATGRFCDVDTDCLSAVCTNGVCRDPSCNDERKNQDETDVDCGGVCAACGDGQRCAAPEDCESGRCASGRCVSCTDGVRNGDESGIDCGGSCGPCQDGGTCSVDEDCATGKCDRGFCCVPNACGECAALPEEVCDGVDNDCDGLTDEAADLGVGPPCEKNTGVCVGARATCRGSQGWTCADSDYRAVSNQYEAVESRCDALDNDCDGETDEGVKNACGTCGAPPVEVCDAVDNDCDGQTDEGVANACGGCGPVPDELCNSLDDDCDGQTDELAACQACMTTPVTLVQGGDWTPSGGMVLLPDLTPVVAVGSGSGFELVRLRSAPTNFASISTATGVRLARVGQDVLVLHQAGSWTMRRLNANGVVQETLSNFLPVSTSVEALHGEGDEALVLTRTSDFGNGNNNTSLYSERRRTAGTWGATSPVSNGLYAATALLVGGEAVRMFLFDTTGSFDLELRSKWGSGGVVKVANPGLVRFYAAVARDGKVHVAFDQPNFQHWVGTSAGWSRFGPAGVELPDLLGGIDFLPTGEPVIIMMGREVVEIAALKNNRWVRKPLVQAEAGRFFNYERSMAIDTYGRIHIAYSDDEGLWARGITVCPAF